MMRFSGSPQSASQPKASALAASNDGDLDATQPTAVSATAEDCTETKTGSLS
jgi:hypothetical protein